MHRLRKPEGILSNPQQPVVRSPFRGSLSAGTLDPDQPFGHSIHRRRHRIVVQACLEKPGAFETCSFRSLLPFCSGLQLFGTPASIFSVPSMERVSLFTPLGNAPSLFVLPLSAIFLKDVEKLTPRKIGAALSVIFGMFWISWEKLRLLRVAFSTDREDAHQRRRFHQHNSARQL